VCHYHGVSLDETEIQVVDGLVFDRYESSVHDMVRRGISFDATKCIEHLKKAIHHLHTLSLVHCDIKPDNIFVKYATAFSPDNIFVKYATAFSPEHYVLGDFDFTHREGTYLGAKAGTPG
jgi:serine/threonine protein kinase